jgi:transposase-like protein
LDEVFIRINGESHYLWRAVDQHGVVLDILAQDRRNAFAAKRFFKRRLQGLEYKPRRLVTDGLRSYGVARRESRSAARSPAPEEPILEQPCGKLASTNTTTRAKDAAVQIVFLGAAVCLGA